MMYYDFQVGEKVYNLRLTTRNIIKLEKKIGVNPLAIFGNGDTVPTLTTMLAVFQYALPNATESEAYDIFDKWLEEGHTLADFIPVILEVYKISGLIKDENPEEKN